MKKHIFTLALIAGLASGTQANAQESVNGNVHVIKQKGGATIGYSSTSGIQILTMDGFHFKDLNRNGKLDKYEDWRLPVEVRAQDLAAQLSVEEIAGLMLYSAHQGIPGGAWNTSHYNGKLYTEGGASASDLTDEQKAFLKDDNLRHVLITTVESPKVAAEWNNKVQAFVEGLGHGIPSNNSSDPRHSATADAEFNIGNGGKISLWPNTLGLAATFDPSYMLKFGQIASKEYRALGMATALSPQVDIATDPRWNRFNGTFGEAPLLAAAMAQAYCDGFQTSTDDAIKDGWGYSSVNAMVKHWPGGGAGEAGRDAHYSFGKFAVYPGKNFEMHKYSFLEGAFKLMGGTQKASAVMPYYTISLGQNPKGENVGNSYSQYIITEQLRKQYGYDGVVCTDWGITADELGVGLHSGKPWGVETKSVAERHFKVLMAGVDQFGGNNDKGPVLEAYRMGIEAYGEKKMRSRFEASAVRLLKNIFRTGLFENPYLDVAQTEKIVGNPTFMQEAYEAQLKSIVMLKNHRHALPLTRKAKVYMPKRFIPEVKSFFGGPGTAAHEVDPVDPKLMEKYFTLVQTPQEADFALAVISNPQSGYGYDAEDVKKGGNGYFPISLQYNDYTATEAREISIGGGDPFENFTNRSYKNKSTKTANKRDMENVQTLRKQMGSKPVIVLANFSGPVVLSEIEPNADAILVGFDIQNQAYMDIMCGKQEPTALLPMQMPKDMTTVEKQFEDVPFDMECYQDTDGHTYDFAFGMNWKGVIKDKRVTEYRK